MFMKTKEWKNFSHPMPKNTGGGRRPNPAAAGGAPILTSGSSILSLQGYPEKFMKTKELKNFMDGPRSGRGECRCAGTLFSISQPCPLSRPKRHSLAKVYKNGGVSGFVTNGLKKSISSILSLTEYPEKFMKTKERENSKGRASPKACPNYGSAIPQ